MTEKGVGIVQRERSGDGYGQWGSFLFFFSRSAAVAAQVFRLARPNLSSEPLLADAASSAAAPCSSSSSGLVVGSSELFRDGLHPLAPHHYGRRHAEQHHALPPPRREPPPPTKKSSRPPPPLSSSASDLAVSLEDCNCFQASSFLSSYSLLHSTFNLPLLPAQWGLRRRPPPSEEVEEEGEGGLRYAESPFLLFFFFLLSRPPPPPPSFMPPGAIFSGEEEEKGKQGESRARRPQSVRTGEKRRFSLRAVGRRKEE